MGNVAVKYKFAFTASTVPKISRKPGERFENESASVFLNLTRGRRDDHNLVRVDIIQHDAGPLVEHVGVEIVGVEQGDLPGQAPMFGAVLGSNGFRRRDFRLKFKQRDDAVISLNHVIGEIRQHQRAEYGQPDVARAQSKIFKCCHKVMES